MTVPDRLKPMMPKIDGGLSTMLLYAPLDRLDYPNRFEDIVHVDTLVPREPWGMLAAGSSPKIYQSRVITQISFDVIVAELDWAGFGLFQHEAFTLAMMQMSRDQGSIRISICRAEMATIDLAWDAIQWKGPAGFKISRVINHDAVEIRAAA